MVASGRKVGREEVVKIADGRIFSGEQAKELGLIDAFGNLQETISLAAEIAGIKGEPNVIYPPKKRFSILDFLFNSIAKVFIEYFEAKSFRSGYLFCPQ